MILISLLMSSLALLSVHRGSAAEASEYEIKATYLYNFAKFADWPQTKKSQNAPLTICLLGGDPFAGSLSRLAQGKTIKNRPIEIKTLTSLEAIKSCYILFVSAKANPNPDQIFHDTQSFNVLSVGESPDFIDLGGQIQFYIKESNVRFEINLPAVQQAGIKIDARVLNIAKIRR